MSTRTATCFFVLLYITILCQSQEFDILNITLPYNGMVNFCVDIFNDKLTTIYNIAEDDLKLCSAPFNYNHLSWTEENENNLPFDAKSIIYSGQVSIEYNNALYGVPEYTIEHKNNIDLCDDQLFIFDLNLNEYRSPETYHSELKYPTYQSCITIAQNKLYIIGGDSDDYWHNVQTYDLIKDTFSKKTSLNTRRKAAGCAINNANSEQATNIYIFGGQSPTYWKFFDSIEKYVIKFDFWVTLFPHMHQGRAFHTCSYIPNNRIYCIGGWNNYGFLKSVEIFDSKKDKILSEMMYLNIPRANHSTMIYNSQLFVLGGHTDYNKKTDTIEGLFIDTLNPTTTYIPSIFPTFQPESKTTSGSAIGWVFGIIITCVIILIIYFTYHHYKDNKLEREFSVMIESEEKQDQQRLNAPLVNNYSDVYHEKQSWEFCLIHALNALLQQKQFTKDNMDIICNNLAPNKLINPHRSILQTGNYDANVLNMALFQLNIDVQWFDSRKANEIDLIDNDFLCPDEYQEFIGFILNDSYKKFKIFSRRHWLAIKQINNIWYNLDSKIATPLKYETVSQITELQNWLINICKNHDGQLMICRRKKQNIN